MGTKKLKRKALRALKKKQKILKLQNKFIDRKSDSLNPSFGKIPNPFSNLTDSERFQAVKAIVETAQKSYEKSLDKVVKFIENYHPLSLLSILTTYHLSVGVGEKGLETNNNESKLEQAHIELFQSILLQTNPDKLGSLPPQPKTIEELTESLKELVSAYNYRGLPIHVDHKDEKESAINFLQYAIRSNTLGVRNWGYFNQVKRISKEIYEKFDEELIDYYGFSATNIMNFFQLLIDHIEKLYTERFQKLKEIYKIKDKRKLAYKYHELFNLNADSVDELLNRSDVESLDTRSLFVMLMSHSELFLLDIFLFSVDTVAEYWGKEKKMVESILNEFSIEVGGLIDHNTEHLYLSNPVWLQPIIKVENNEYFCAVPQVFFSFILPSLERLIVQSGISKEQLSNVRARFLEKDIKRKRQLNTSSNLFDNQIFRFQIHRQES